MFPFSLSIAFYPSVLNSTSRLFKATPWSTWKRLSGNRLIINVPSALISRKYKGYSQKFIIEIGGDRGRNERARMCMTINHPSCERSSVGRGQVTSGQHWAAPPEVSSIRLFFFPFPPGSIIDFAQWVSTHTVTRCN